jgi:hypothetical protein
MIKTSKRNPVKTISDIALSYRNIGFPLSRYDSNESSNNKIPQAIEVIRMSECGITEYGACPSELVQQCFLYDTGKEETI